MTKQQSAALKVGDLCRYPIGNNKTTLAIAIRCDHPYHTIKYLDTEDEYLVHGLLIQHPRLEDYVLLAVKGAVR